EQALPFGSTMMLDAMRRVTRRLDTRPQHATWLAYHAYRNLFDLNLADALNRYLLTVEEPSRSEVALWAAFLSSDTGRLRRLVCTRSTSVERRLLAANYLRRILGWSAPAVDAGYRALSRDFPENWSVVEARTLELAKNGRYGEARQVFADWLARDLPDSGLQ